MIWLCILFVLVVVDIFIWTNFIREKRTFQKEMLEKAKETSREVSRMAEESHNTLTRVSKEIAEITERILAK